MARGDQRPDVEERFPYLLDVRAGAVLFVAFAGFALSPLGQYVDRVTHLDPLRPGMPGFALTRDVLDRVAGQGGEGLVMAAVAVVMTAVMRSSLPLVVTGLAEGLFYLTGLVKIGFAKDAPRFGLPSYWEGGYLAHGKYGMAFPSGHTTEAVLIFGTIVLLLQLGRPGWTGRHARGLKRLWWVVGINSAVVAWALGTHWLTDLAGGLIFGAIALRVLVVLVARGYAGAVAAVIDQALARAVVRLARLVSGRPGPVPSAPSAPPPLPELAGRGRPSR